MEDAHNPDEPRVYTPFFVSERTRLFMALAQLLRQYSERITAIVPDMRDNDGIEAACG